METPENDTPKGEAIGCVFALLIIIIIGAALSALHLIIEQLTQ